MTKTAVEDETSAPGVPDDQGFVKLNNGQVKFLELDAEKMGDFFNDRQGSFDAVWISEALSHFPNKPLFFENVMKVLKPGGKLVLADWFKAEDLDDTTFTNDIKPIEGKVQLSMIVFLSLNRNRWYAPPASLYPTGVPRYGKAGWASDFRRAKGYQPTSSKNMVSTSASSANDFDLDLTSCAF